MKYILTIIAICEIDKIETHNFPFTGVELILYCLISMVSRNRRFLLRYTSFLPKFDLDYSSIQD